MKKIVFPFNKKWSITCWRADSVNRIVFTYFFIISWQLCLSGFRIKFIDGSKSHGGGDTQTFCLGANRFAKGKLVKNVDKTCQLIHITVLYKLKLKGAPYVETPRKNEFCHPRSYKKPRSIATCIYVFNNPS